MTLTALACVLLLTAAYPLGLAWVRNRRSSLSHALTWAAAAWTCWVAAWATEVATGEAVTLRYLALGLTGCAGVAVLGARRPGVAAWNFVVLGLLAVFLLPVALGLGRPRLEWAHVTFLAVALAVGVLNYLPTRLVLAALFLGLGCGGELWGLAVGGPPAGPSALALGVSRLALALAPWVALVQVRQRVLPPDAFDRLWLGFRDRFGFVWAQRLREQFNAAAANAGWPVVLRWRGLRRVPGTARPGPETQTEFVGALRALLKRFEGPEA